MADTDKRAAAIAALTKALQDYDDTERGVRPGWVDSQVVVAARLALHALDSDGAAMLRELRDTFLRRWHDAIEDKKAHWTGTPERRELQAVADTYQQACWEIDRLLAAKPAPEPEPQPVANDESHRPDRSPRFHGSADSTPPEGAASPAAEPPAADEARIAEWLRQCQEHISSGAIPSTLETHGALSQAKTLMRDLAARADRHREAAATHERMRKAAAERFTATRERLEAQIVDLRRRAEKAEAEVDRLRAQRDALVALLGKVRPRFQSYEDCDAEGCIGGNDDHDLREEIEDTIRAARDEKGNTDGL